MSIHAPAEVADAANNENRAILAASAALREPPHCQDGCACACDTPYCACHDEERLSWRSREADLGPAPILPKNVPMSPEVREKAEVKS